LVERDAGAVVNLHSPAQQLGGDTAAELAVGGDENRPPAGSLGRGAQP
jgi:hypothetical protein